MSRYGVKEVFNTLQGEGARAGSRAVFVRFSGCNLWDGHPLHRDEGRGACAKWCDTDFFKGEVLDLEQLLARMDKEWPAEHAAPMLAPRHSDGLVDGGPKRWCVLTGGEPTLQMDLPLMKALHDAGWLVAVETNGTSDSAALHEADWVCVSPKRGAPVKVSLADELKVVLPGAMLPDTGWTDDELRQLAEDVSAAHLSVQPMDPVMLPNLVAATALRASELPQMDDETAQMGEAYYAANLKRCFEFVIENPRWHLGLQLHKALGLP